MKISVKAREINNRVCENEALRSPGTLQFQCYIIFFYQDFWKLHENLYVVT